MSIELHCLDLINRYCVTADHNDVEGFLAVFTEDAVWTQPSGTVVRGHEALRSFFVNRPRGSVVRHISSNAVVDAVDGDNARGISYATVFRFAGDGIPPGPAEALDAMIEYHDDYVRTSSGWKIKARRGTTVFRRT